MLMSWLTGCSSGDPPVSRNHPLCPLGCPTGSALLFPICCQTSVHSSGLSLAAPAHRPRYAVVGGLPGFSDVSHKKGQDMRNPEAEGPSCILQLSLPFLQEAWPLELTRIFCFLPNDATEGKDACHGVSETSRGHRPCQSTRQSLNKTVEIYQKLKTAELHVL